MAKKQINLSKKSEVEVNLYLDITDEENIKVVPDEEEIKYKDNISENIFLLKSKWAKPNFTLQQIIEANSYSEKLVMNKVQRFFDPNALTISHIKCLLKDSNISELDPNIQLTFEPSIDNRDVKILSDASMRQIGQLPPVLVIGLYNKMFAKLFLSESSESKKSQSPMEEMKA